MLDIDAIDERAAAIQRTSRHLAAADALAQEVVRALLRRGTVRDRYLLDALDAAAERYVQALGGGHAGQPSREDVGAAWSLACPRCQAESGSMCHDTPGGQPRQIPHPERAAKAMRWRLAVG